MLNRLKNVGTLVGVASAVVFILTSNGVAVDSERIMNTVKAVCTIGMLLGFMNNPDTPGLDIPFMKKTEDKE